MKFKTVFNAMMGAWKNYRIYGYDKSLRQYWKFRDYLVRRDARMEGEISRLKAERDFWKAEALQEDEE